MRKMPALAKARAATGSVRRIPSMLRRFEPKVGLPTVAAKAAVRRLSKALPGKRPSGSGFHVLFKRYRLRAIRKGDVADQAPGLVLLRYAASHQHCEF
jgi:hypothetical protein